MKARFLTCALAMALSAFSQGATAAKSDSCAHCHGTDGNSTSSAYPSLAGQTREYLYRQIKAFKDNQVNDINRKLFKHSISTQERFI